MVYFLTYVLNQIHVNSWFTGLELLNNGLGCCFKVRDICFRGVGHLSEGCKTFVLGVQDKS